MTYFLKKTLSKKGLDKFHRKSLPEGEGEARKEMEMKRETGFADSYFLSLWERTEVRAQAEGKLRAQKNH